MYKRQRLIVAVVVLVAIVATPVPEPTIQLGSNVALKSLRTWEISAWADVAHCVSELTLSFAPFTSAWVEATTGTAFAGASVFFSSLWSVMTTQLLSASNLCANMMALAAAIGVAAVGNAGAFMGLHFSAANSIAQPTLSALAVCAAHSIVQGTGYLAVMLTAMATKLWWSIPFLTFHIRFI